MRLVVAILLLTLGDTTNGMLAKTVFHKAKAILRKGKTTPMPGVWGQWGTWDENCSVTCGIGVRRRTRTCNYTGKEKKGRCKGHAGEMKNCDTKLTCPVHGGWTSWVTWDCTVSCGGGIGIQKRTCTNPRPMFDGKDCEGPSEEDGTCNARKCADQVYKLSRGTLRALKDATEKVQFNFEKREGSNVLIPCNAKVLEKIYKEYPSSILFWTKNGDVLKVDGERMEVSLTELSILELNPRDSGVYLCNMRYAPGVVKPLTVATVAVTPKKSNIQVSKDDRLVLICNGAQLARIYQTLTQTWLLNGEVFNDFSNATVLDNNMYAIKNAMPNMTGTWTCQIKDPERGWTWTTNILKVKVSPPAPLYLKLLRNKTFLLGVGTAAFLTIMTLGTFFGYKITRAREDFRVDFKMWSLIAADEEIMSSVSESAENTDDIFREEDNGSDVGETSSHEEEPLISSVE